MRFASVVRLILLQSCATYVQKGEAKTFYDTVAAATAALEKATAEVDQDSQQDLDLRRVIKRGRFSTTPRATSCLARIPYRETARLRLTNAWSRTVDCWGRAVLAKHSKPFASLPITSRHSRTRGLSAATPQLW